MLSLNFSPFPTLSTQGLVLRRITEDDAAALFEMRSDKKVMEFIHRPLAQTIDDVLALIKVIQDQLDANNGITWGITLPAKGKLMGTIGFWQVQKEHYRAEIGYLLHSSLQRKGIMHEALMAVLEYGFKNMQLHSVEANVAPENIASIKLLEKNNFIREAYYKENFYFEGRFLDSAIYSLLAPKA